MNCPAIHREKAQPKSKSRILLIDVAMRTSYCRKDPGSKLRPLSVETIGTTRTGTVIRVLKNCGTLSPLSGSRSHCCAIAIVIAQQKRSKSIVKKLGVLC